jgi:hypothetical protein
MLKFWLALLLVLLLVLNAIVLAWQWDAFARWGHGPHQHREPVRLQEQVKPEALKFEAISAASATPPLPAMPDANALPPAADASVPDTASPAPALPAPASSALQAAPR